MRSLTKHEFTHSGWDNYDCVHCAQSGYTSRHEFCEEEDDYRSSGMYKRKLREEAESLKQKDDQPFITDLIELLRKHKYIP